MQAIYYKRPYHRIKRVGRWLTHVQGVLKRTAILTLNINLKEHKHSLLARYIPCESPTAQLSKKTEQVVSEKFSFE